MYSEAKGELSTSTRTSEGTPTPRAISAFLQAVAQREETDPVQGTVLGPGLA